MYLYKERKTWVVAVAVAIVVVDRRDVTHVSKWKAGVHKSLEPGRRDD